LRHWIDGSRDVYNSSKYKWKSLSTLRNTTDIFDCLADINAANGITSNSEGYPIEGRAGPYGLLYSGNFGSDDSATLYSANYVAYLETEGSAKRSRIDIAQSAITKLINTTPSVDFGLAIFNDNSKGGRILDKIQTRDATSTLDLIDTINDLNANGGTPLCETMWEAYLYMGGNDVYYGDAYNDRDKTAESNGVYQSPFKECQERAYIILMTDGEPTSDSGSNNRIKTLTGKSSSIEGSYMPVLAEWMNNNDIDKNDENGNQYITTYTIGFGENAVDKAGKMLLETATRGGGGYFPATSSEALQSAFNSTILNILNTTSSLSSPALATNNFDRTRSLDSVYYSMFLPTSKAVWKGNIKKLKINADGVIVDSKGVSAINGDGNIKASASTFWGGDQDGNTVTEGGVSQMLGNNTDERKVLSNIEPSETSIINDVIEIGGSTGILDETTSDSITTVESGEASLGLLEPNKENLKSYYGVSTDIALANILGIETPVSDTSTETSENVTNTLNWLKGVDVDDSDEDSNTEDSRNNIFGDPLHSKPLTITYIENKGETNEKQIVRFLVGTNAGFLHMFTDNGATTDKNGLTDSSATDSVTENWAFIPEQLINSAIKLRDDEDSSEHHYGIDLAPIAIKKYDTDGGVEKIIAIVGMRRGGSSYFALDITDADTPILLWKIDGGSTGFEQLAQTWSIPSVGTFSYGDKTNQIGVVFAGGYDENKDTCEVSNDDNCDDTIGRAVYIVDALTGDKIWSAQTADDCTTLHCMNDSIPSQVSLLDSNYDSITDRIYVGDSGANVWRMDLLGTDTSKWSLTKLANLGGDTAETNRRFFTAPVIVRTYKNTVSEIEDTGEYSFQNTAYDGLLLGSGDRAHPASDTTTNDYYFNIHDYNVAPILFGTTGYSAKPNPLAESDFYEITNDPVANYEGDQILSVYAEMSANKGWVYKLNDLGEKSLGQGVVLDGSVYFTSFVPNSTININCGIGDLGNGWLYKVDLHTGKNLFQEEDGIERLDIGAQVPDSLVIYSGEDANGNSDMRLLGVGQGDSLTVDGSDINMGSVDVDSDMSPHRIYEFYTEK